MTRSSRLAQGNRPKPLSRSMIILVSLEFSLFMGFIDIMISILPGPSGLYTFSALLWPLIATIAAFFMVSLVSWYLVANPLRWLLNLDATYSIISLGFFLVTSFALIDLTRFPLQPGNLVKFFMLFVISLLLSTGAFFTTKIGTKHSDRRRRGAVYFLTAPILAGEFLVFVWAHVYWAGSFFSTGSYLILAGLLLTLIFTLGWGCRVKRLAVMKHLVVLFTAVVVSSPFALVLFTRPARQPPVRENRDRHAIRQVILLTVDTLRRDALSCYAPAGAGTPCMDTLAGDGILFTNALAPAPWTLPSVSSIMTGFSPSVHRATRPGTKLPGTLPTLAESMGDEGYLTAAIVSNSFLSPKFNLSRGFVDYDFYPRYSLGDSFGALLLERLFAERFRRDITAEELTNLAIQWLETHSDRDFFLWVHYFAPHIPYAPPRRFIPDVDPADAIGYRLSEELASEIHQGTYVPSMAERAWIQVLYQGEVRYVDANIGRIIDALERLGIYDPALIVLTSDHGEEFWEHDRFEHGHTLYNELLRVPLIVKLPGPSPPEGRIDTFVPNQAIGPTILDLCATDGGTPPREVDSLARLWSAARDSAAGEPIVSEGLYFFEDRESVVFEGHKYIRFLITGREELYDLTNDPDEEESILDDSPDRVREANEILADHDMRAAGLRARFGIEDGEAAKIDDDTLRRLRALGYL